MATEVDDVILPTGVFAPGVVARRTRTKLLLFAADGVTCCALDPHEFGLLVESTATDAEERDRLLGELAATGIIAGVAPPPSRRVALTRSGVELAGLDPIVRQIVAIAKPLVGLPWLAFAVVLTTVALAVGLLSLDATTLEHSALHTAVTLLVLENLLLVIHELGHAVVLIRYGGRVGRAGFGFYWGSVSFFVDSTSALLLPRRHRLVQASAGVAAEGVAVGVLVVAAAASGSQGLSVIGAQATLLLLASILTNAAPALGLDGAWILADVLDRPTMVPGAGAPSSRGEQRWRTANAVLGVIALVGSLAIWWALWHDLLEPLWHGGVAGKLVAGVAVLPFAASLLAGALWLCTARAAQQVPQQQH